MAVFALFAMPVPVYLSALGSGVAAALLLIPLNFADCRRKGSASRSPSIGQDASREGVCLRVCADAFMLLLYANLLVPGAFWALFISLFV